MDYANTNFKKKRVGQGYAKDAFITIYIFIGMHIKNIKVMLFQPN